MPFFYCREIDFFGGGPLFETSRCQLFKAQKSICWVGGGGALFEIFGDMFLLTVPAVRFLLTVLSHYLFAAIHYMGILVQLSCSWVQNPFEIQRHFFGYVFAAFPLCNGTSEELRGQHFLGGVPQGGAPFARGGML